MAKTKGEQYYIDKLKAEMDKDGKIQSIDAETRVYLKNKYRRLNLKLSEKEQMHSISEMIAMLIPGAVYVTNEQAKKENYSNEAILKRLNAIVVEVEDRKTGKKKKQLDFSKDEALRNALRHRAEKQGISLADLVKATGCEVVEVAERNIPLSEHIANILDCVDAKKNVVCLAKKYPTTHHYLSYIAKKNKCGYNITLNKLLGSEIQEYTYIGIKNKLSKYDMENPAYVGNDEEFVGKVKTAILSCMDENLQVNGLSKQDTIYKMLIKIAQTNDLTLSSVVSDFVPEAIYEGNEPSVMKHQTKADVLKNLERFDDGSGCIDSIRASKTAIKSLRRFAKEEGLHMSEFVEKYTDKYFSSCNYEIDYIDYVIKKLVARYGVGGEVSGLSQDDLQLYNAVQRIKKFFPGGAKRTMEETFVALGFTYEGIAADTKFTEDYVRSLLINNFGNEGGEIESIFDLGDVGVAVLAYSGIVGKGIKDTLEDFGYTYLGENQHAKNRLTSKKMTLKEYQDYKKMYAKQNDEENSQPGEE